MPNSVTEAVDLSLASLMRQQPVSCVPGTRTQDALTTMRDRHIGSMIVTDAQLRPIGIVTLRDVLDRIALEPGALQRPIETLMTPNLVTLPADSSAYQASLAMIRHGINHIMVVKGDQLAGLLSARDLFGLQHGSVKDLSTAIRGADSLDAIESFGHDIGALTRKMLVQGVATGPMCAFIASLNDLLTQRIVELEFREASVPYCWILMGSEGRGEQTLVTDQDNGLIFHPPAGSDIEKTRLSLLAVARRVNLALDRAGYSLCPGDIMAGNAQWCLTLEEWRSRFEHWFASGSPDALLHGTIFFDLKALTGDTALARALRDWLTAHAPKHPRLLHLMTQNALRNRAPLGVFGQYKTDAHGNIDLKLNGTTLFADAGRIFSLGAGVDETNTERRLRESGPRLNVPAAETEAWIAAYYCLQGHRLRNQASAIARSVRPDNALTPASLNDFERAVLKLAFRQAASMQKRLAMAYGVR